MFDSQAAEIVLLCQINAMHGALGFARFNESDNSKLDKFPSSVVSNHNETRFNKLIAWPRQSKPFKKEDSRGFQTALVEAYVY